MSSGSAVKSERRGDVEVFILRQRDGLTAEVAPALGNNCFAHPALEPVSFEEFHKRPTSYGIPILFPFPNRIRDGEFFFRGRRYVVTPNRHGFVRDKAWTVVATGASDEEGAWITSRLDAADYPEEILGQFPFPFRLELTYRLKDLSLNIEATVQNTGERDMPFGFGIHPYFKRPERGSITVPAEKRWQLVDNLPTGTLLDVEGDYDLRQGKDVQGLLLDDIFTALIPGSGDKVSCLLRDEAAGMLLRVDFDAKQFPHVVVYTPPPPRRAICIEPYSCATDGFNLQERGIEAGVTVLPPGETISFWVGIAVSLYSVRRGAGT